MKISNYEELCKSLEGLGDKYFTANAEKYRYSIEREKGIDIAKGLIRKFSEKRNGIDPGLSNGMTHIKIF